MCIARTMQCKYLFKRERGRRGEKIIETETEMMKTWPKATGGKGDERRTIEISISFSV